MLFTIFNFVVLALVSAFCWWGVLNHRSLKPRELWSRANGIGAILYILSALAHQPDWLTLLSSLSLPFVVWIFFVLNERWGRYLDSLSTQPEASQTPT
ncbi:hypothetical protein AB0N05_04845 [Nocardia sp. NPDC051030]|uniref:hypothetical protein n=1 Tax=Nocardia sp. NPDC051030 TaxID=3155162 RepID=UPI00343706F7